MNRHDRRKAAKLSRDATPDEIMPPGERHAPIVPEAREQMLGVMQALKQTFGERYDITLFIAERQPQGGRDLPRFNYASTADRADMVAVLEAFVQRQKEQGAKLDRIADVPPSERPQ